MKRILVALLLGLGTVAFSAQPLFAACQDTVQQQDKKKDNQKKTETVTFKTTIHCDNCVKKINENISFEKGVKDLSVTLDNQQVTITYDPSKTDEAALVKAIEKLGYSAEKVEPKKQ